MKSITCARCLTVLVDQDGVLQARACDCMHGGRADAAKGGRGGQAPEITMAEAVALSRLL